MQITYKTEQVCAKEIKIEWEGDVVKHVEFVGGCPGNALGIVHLVKDKPAREIIEKLQGIECRHRSTSCPDQLAKALEEHVHQL